MENENTKQGAVEPASTGSALRVGMRVRLIEKANRSAMRAVGWKGCESGIVTRCDNLLVLVKWDDGQGYSLRPDTCADFLAPNLVLSDRP